MLSSRIAAIEAIVPLYGKLQEEISANFKTVMEWFKSISERLPNAAPKMTDRTGIPMTIVLCIPFRISRIPV